VQADSTPMQEDSVPVQGAAAQGADRILGPNTDLGMPRAELTSLREKLRKPKRLN